MASALFCDRIPSYLARGCSPVLHIVHAPFVYIVWTQTRVSCPVGSGCLVCIQIPCVDLADLTCTLASMQRLRDGRRWSVFDPVDVPFLFETTGPEFTAAYAAYEDSGLAVGDYDVEAIWRAVVDSQRETGSPFILFQDHINGGCLRRS